MPSVTFCIPASLQFKDQQFKLHEVHNNSQLGPAVEAAMRRRNQPILKILLDALGGYVSLHGSFHTTV